MVRDCLTIGLVVLFGASTIPAQAAKPPSYEMLLENVKKKDPKADFKALRMAYSKTQAYNPYDFGRQKAQQAMNRAIKAKDYAQALQLARNRLEKNYVDVQAHMVASLSYKQLGKADRSDYHRYVADGLIKSILKSGDGKSEETAFVVISTDEEYVVLDVLGINLSLQALVRGKKHTFDVLSGVDENKKKVKFYFNIDIPHTWLEKSFSK
jgi:hypothetical protein